jgi:DNA invertase Pin-like site-specific DNA recombinase
MEPCAIYLRVSTKEQNELIQKEDCVNYAKNHGYEVVNILTEKVSAYKEEVERPERDKIMQLAHEGKIKHIIVWAFDRWIRRRDLLIEDMEKLLLIGCKLHSIKDAWYESINIDGPLGKTIREFMLGLIGSLAEVESQRRSERILLGKSKTKVKQGAKEKVKFKAEIINLYATFKTLHKVAEEYNKNHRPCISYGTVYNIIKRHKAASQINFKTTSENIS